MKTIHELAIDFIASQEGFVSNHSKKGRMEVPARHYDDLGNEKQCYVVPDLVGLEEIVEVEATTSKHRYYNLLENKKKILFLVVDSLEAFDEVYLYSFNRDLPPFGPSSRLGRTTFKEIQKIK